MTRAAWRLLAARRGNAAVEFALLTPVLLGLTIPIADLGLLAYDQMQVQLAAQAAEYAARHGWDPTGIRTPSPLPVLQDGRAPRARPNGSTAPRGAAFSLLRLPAIQAV